MTALEDKKSWCYSISVTAMNTGIPRRYCGFSSQPPQSREYCSKAGVFFADGGSCLQFVNHNICEVQ